MALLGPEGLERLAMRTAAAAQETMETVLGVDGVELLFPSTPIFREFAIQLPISSEAALERMDRHGVTGGFDLSRWWASMNNALLIGCDERTSMDDIRKLSESLEKAIKEGSH
jgi:glycine dehydrogenase subunit 1